MSELDALLAGLRDRADALAKAQPGPKENVVEPAVAEAEAPAATEETVAKGGEAGAEAAVTEAAPEVAAETVEAVAEEAGDTAKSFKVKLEDGTEADAVDGFALIKALGEKLDVVLADVATLKSVPAVQGEAIEVESFDFEGMQKSFDERTETMAKALATAMDALATSQAQVGELTQKMGVQAEQIAQQSTTLKALSDKVTAFGATGRGRASTVSVHEKPSPAATPEPQQTVGEIFAKANALSAAGKLTAVDAGRINAWVNAGRGVPPEYAALFAA